MSLAVQWLRLHASNAEDMGLICGWGTEIPHAMWHGLKISQQQKKRTNKNPYKHIQRQQNLTVLISLPNIDVNI